jgi:hypothetical protein
MTDKDDLIYSPLQRSFSSEGQTVKIQIYRLPDTGWTLEVVDEFNNSTVWDNEFATDQEALDEFLAEVKTDGIHSYIGNGPDDKVQ